MADMHDATEEYLATILELEEAGIRPMRARLVERLGLTAPAVSDTVNRLIAHHFLELRPDRTLALTEAGREIAVRTLRRHRLAERLLVDVIGLEWEKVHREAARWEHVISADVEAKLVALLGDPATCPHGNPIPGSRHRGASVPSVALDRVGPGPVEVRRISEDLEADDDAIGLLSDLHLVPGSHVVVRSSSRDGVVIEAEGHERVVPVEVAAGTYVTAG